MVCCFLTFVGCLLVMVLCWLFVGNGSLLVCWSVFCWLFDGWLSVLFVGYWLFVGCLLVIFVCWFFVGFWLVVCW